MEIQLLGPEDTPITAVSPCPANVDPKYPRLHFKGTGVRTISGVQDNTMINGHVDRHLDGTIQWAFVRLPLNLWLTPEADPKLQVSRYGNVIWMSVLVV